MVKLLFRLCHFRFVTKQNYKSKRDTAGSLPSLKVIQKYCRNCEMPQDYRRFNGPEDSVSYKRYTNEFLKTYNELENELLDNKELRKDGRGITEARSMCMFFATTQVVSQAKGSAYVERDKTKIICSVFDPREIPHQNEFSQLGQLYCEVKFATFACPHRRRPHAPDAEEKALSVALRKSLEPAVCRHLFPNYQVDIFVYILEHDGACLANAINAAGLALADAAVPMYDVITASSIAVVGNKIFVDPIEFEEHLAVTSSESKTNHGVVTLAMLPELKQISQFSHIGSLDAECLTTAMDILEKECVKIVPHVQKVLVANLVKGFEQRKKMEQESKERELLLNTKMEEWKKLLNAG